MFKVQNRQQVNQQTITLLEKGIGKQQQILYMRFANDKLNTVCLNLDKQIIIRQCSLESEVKIACKTNQFQMLETEIAYAFIQGADGFIIYKNPFRIYYLTKQEQKPIKLQLEEQISYSWCCIQLQYPRIIIFGTKQSQNCSFISQLNMETLSFKIINDGKGYSPGLRTESISIMMDDRIYTFGGKDQKGNICDKMIWVYDMEKGYWFALEMDYPDQDFSKCIAVPITTSRALIYNQQYHKSWILQIHQSRLTKVEGNLNLSSKLISIKGQIVTYCKKKCNIQKKLIKYFKVK